MNAGFRFVIAVAAAVASTLSGAASGFVVGRVSIPLLGVEGPPAGVGLIMVVFLFAFVGGIVGFVFCWRRIGKRVAT